MINLNEREEKLAGGKRCPQLFDVHREAKGMSTKLLCKYYKICPSYGISIKKTIA